MKDHFAPIDSFNTFGDLLKYLRRRAHLSQRELSIAVSYSESHICRMERNQRAPDRAGLQALFVPVLGIEDEPEIIDRLLILAGSQKLKTHGQVKQTEVQTQSRVALPIKTSGNRRNHLPLQMTSFVGRKEDLADLCHMLRNPLNRLVTLTGEGGCGKTRLALHSGEEVAEAFEHGVWLVEMATLTDPLMVPKTITSIFGLMEGMSHLENLLVEYLQPKNLLLILDNCEHLLDAIAEIVVNLLQSCPGLQILATSRQALGVPGEQIFRVMPLSLPSLRPGASPLRSDIEHYDAIYLFVERARLLERSFSLRDQNAAAVVRICNHLDGIPLAIELAAAWVNLLQPEQIATRLEENFNLLTGHSPYRLYHQTMRNTVDWSYNLLSEEERVLLLRLAVFAGGWLLETAEAVCSWPPVGRTQVFELLNSLVSKSLVIVDLSKENEARYRILEPIREVLFEMLEKSGEIVEIRNRHLAYFVSLVEQASPELISHQQAEWIYRLEEEGANLRLAMYWCKQNHRLEEGLRLTGGLWRFWFTTGDWSLGRDWCQEMVELTASDLNLKESLLRARTFLALSWMLSFLRQIDTFWWAIDQALELFRKHNDMAGIGAALCLKGSEWLEPRAGLAIMEEGLRYSQWAEDSWWIAFNKH